jgi:hypothetical protein
MIEIRAPMELECECAEGTQGVEGGIHNRFGVSEEDTVRRYSERGLAQTCCRVFHHIYKTTNKSFAGAGGAKLLQLARPRPPQLPRLGSMLQVSSRTHSADIRPELYGVGTAEHLASLAATQ